ncbi:MAG: FG-GAP repeat protein [Ignavibacteria bacterium]|nr:FG-GAP repeat protein [Ignavibacteria bacterium]
MNNVADIILTGETTGRYLGESVSSADFNKDGFSDVLVGEPGYNSNTGRAHIFFGGAIMNNIPDVTMTGESNNSYFGMVSSSADDVNGDSYPDVIVSAMNYGGETGRAYIYYGGSSMNNAVDLTLNGENGHFGSWTAAGDMNGDGYSDVIIGAYRYGSDDRGKVYLYHGGNPMNNSPDLIFLGKESGSLLGNTLAGVGDLNKDGYSDIILPEATKGRAYVHFGGALMDTVADIINYQDTPGRIMLLFRQEVI